VQIAKPCGSTDPAWLALRLRLWPDASAPEHLSNGTSSSPVAFLEGLYVDNPGAHAAHRALGFEETERVIYFRRASQAA
jgi:hypothetical protein